MAAKHGAANDCPHSFVLADLFDVVSLEQEVPEHVYESDPSLEWVTCPCCDGKKWVKKEGNGWCDALFSDPRMIYAHRHLNYAYKICGRCNGCGEVLAYPALTPTTQLLLVLRQPAPITVLAA